MLNRLRHLSGLGHSTKLGHSPLVESSPRLGYIPCLEYPLSGYCFGILLFVHSDSSVDRVRVE